MDASALTAAPVFDRLPAAAWSHIEALGPSGYLVLAALAHHQDRDGALFVSVRRLADLTHVDERTVQRGLVKLAAAGLVAATQRAGKATLFRINYPRSERDDIHVTPRSERDDMEVTGDTGDGVTPMSPRTIKKQEASYEAAPPAAPKRERPQWPEVPPGFEASAEFLDLWRKWRGHRGKAISPTSAAATFEQFHEWGLARTVAALKHSLRKGYAGVFEPKEHGRLSVDGQGTAAERTANHAKWASVSETLEP